ncbi:MAG: adenylosuccinate lyase [Candidatus Terrybacteria bacterium RIFCSPLOWO2_01_FULL_40_23]|uniref:Adenylosuccinate lyase n=1 Tax=Candidatus Terrybacteria bacterium RIFCSPLOWO2_01_FULL_40_23 TaxID=1802366 RepID=A0A1G2PV40_9BACT|nr:MAG: adenylosuccinate lyase [Candidatus Terrybacteria bacterium RIFCSPLOWO2_01_FULL_40_23]
MGKPKDTFDDISPIDYRYWDEETAKYLSEKAFVKYKILVEISLAKALYERGMYSESVFREIKAACGQVTVEEVYDEEKRIHHDVRALVNCIRANVSAEAKPYIHLTATSYDIVDTANALRYKQACENVLVPALINLEEVLISLALKEAETTQVGRTHGQHAVPITFGFAVAGYISRIGKCIKALNLRSEELTGKFSGATGAYNASSLFFDDPENFEQDILSELGLFASEHSTQIVPPEAFTRLFSEIIIVAGVLANLADDMRNLQRTEIAEIQEDFEETQVGSSTMPQKQNPISFENVKSSWKIVVPRMITVYMDQISEHQRDLTNSASSRTYSEIITYVVYMAKRLTQAMGSIKVNKRNIKRNLSMQKGLILAEPLHVVLAALGHPDAHEKVKTLVRKAQDENCNFHDVIICDPEIQKYLEKMTREQQKAVSSVFSYSGIAAEKSKTIAKKWKRELGL